MASPTAAARDSPLRTKAPGPAGSGERSSSQTAYPRNRAAALEIRILCAVRIVTQGPGEHAGSASLSGESRTGCARASTRFRVMAAVDPPPGARAHRKAGCVMRPVWSQTSSWVVSRIVGIVRSPDLPGSRRARQAPLRTKLQPRSGKGRLRVARTVWHSSCFPPVGRRMFCSILGQSSGYRGPLPTLGR